jgi:hypothetical protein
LDDSALYQLEHMYETVIADLRLEPGLDLEPFIAKLEAQLEQVERLIASRERRFAAV